MAETVERPDIEIGEMEIRCYDSKMDIWIVEISGHAFRVEGRENIPDCIQAEIIGPINRMVETVLSPRFTEMEGSYVRYTRMKNSPYWTVASGSNPKDIDPDVPWTRQALIKRRRRSPKLPTPQTKDPEEPKEPGEDKSTVTSQARKPKSPKML